MPIVLGDPRIAAKAAVNEDWFADPEDLRLMGFGKIAGKATALHNLRTLMDSNDPNVRIMGVYYNGKPVGFVWVVYLGDVTKTVAIHAFAEKGTRGSWAFHLGIKKLLDNLFKNGIYRVEAHPLRINKKMISILKNYGFTQEGIKRSSHWMDGEVHDTVILRMLRREWKEKKKCHQQQR